MIVQGMTTAFKASALTLSGLKLALYTASADLNPQTLSAYTSTGEVVATGYSAGGVSVTASAVGTSGAMAYITFDDVTIASANIVARGALIYDPGNANLAILVLDFGADKSSTGGSFVINMPPLTADAALLGFN